MDSLVDPWSYKVFSAIVIAAMIATYIAAMQINLAFTMACSAMIAASIAWFAYYGDPPLSDNAAQPMEEDQAAYAAYCGDYLIDNARSMEGDQAAYAAHYGDYPIADHVLIGDYQWRLSNYYGAHSMAEDHVEEDHADHLHEACAEQCFGN